MAVHMELLVTRDEKYLTPYYVPIFTFSDHSFAMHFAYRCL
jgi:hypothetical protein